MGLRANCMTCMQLCAVSQERWNALPPSQRGSWEAWKNEWLETWQHLLWFHIPGNFDLQQRNQNKKSPSCWEACTTGRWGCGGEVGAGWNNEASHVHSIWVTLAQLKAFVMVKVRGNSNALQGCQKLVGYSAWCTEKQTAATKEMWRGTIARRWEELSSLWSCFIEHATPTCLCGTVNGRYHKQEDGVTSDHRVTVTTEPPGSHCEGAYYNKDWVSRGWENMEVTIKYADVELSDQRETVNKNTS